MPVTKLVVGELYTNCFIVNEEGSRDALVVDAGGNAPRIAQEIDELGLQPRMLVLTHGHVDHIAAAAGLKERYPEMKLALGAAETETYTRPTYNLSFFLGGALALPEPDVLLDDGQEVTVGSCALRVIHISGHTPGGIALYGQLDGANVVFAGDALFASGIGRTDFPGGSTSALLEGIRSRLLVLPDDTRVYAGHGPETTIGREKRDNPFLR